MSAPHTPPRLAVRLLEHRLRHTSSSEAILGDLAEEFAARAAISRARAVRWYWRQALSAARPTPHADAHASRWSGTAWRRVWQDAWQDVRLGLRQVRRAPGFALTVIATLSVGIGVATAVGSATARALLRPLPFAAPGALVALGDGDGDGVGNVGFETILDWRSRLSSVADIAILRAWQPTLSDDNGAVRLDGMRVSANYFRLLGARPAIGRDFEASDDRPDAPLVAMISDGLWRRHFAASPTVVGQSLDFGGREYRVIGVLPASFEPLVSERFYERAEVWSPLRYAAGGDSSCRSCRHLKAIGRLRATSSVASARAELTAVHASLARDFPADYKRDTPRLQALQSVLNDAVAQPLTALLAATVFVLLVACGNVAGLLLARATGRSSEMALRVALGAGRGRLARQLVAESVALGLPAMAGGYFVARAALTLLAERAPIVIPRLGGAAADPWLFVGAAAASALALALASLWPAWLASRTSALDSRLRATRVSAAAGTVRARRWMLGAQIAAAVLVTAGAALLYRTVDHLLAVDPGFRANGVVTAGFQLLGQRWAEDDAVRAFQKDVVARMRGLPGVRDAALAGQVPLGGNYDRWTARLPGGGNGANAQEVSAERYSVTPNYFSMMQVPLKRGRLLTDADRFGQDLVIVVNETFAREAWPGADPIGQRVRFGSDARPRPATVVGVVGDVRHYALSSPANPQFYATEDQLTDSFLVLLIQTDGARNAPAPDIRKAMAALAPDVPVYEIRPFDSIVSASVATRTFLLVLLASLGGATLVLAGVGVYGVTAESVTARRRELGIRVALGADGRRVAQTILGGNFRVVAAGIAIGLAASALAGFLARGLLFETTPIDPLALTTAAGLLLLSAAVAHVGPLRRAVRADPRNALTGD